MLALVVAITITQFSCSKSDSDPNNNPTPNPNTINCSGVNPSFSTEVLPLIETKCAINSDCHGSGSTNTGGPLTNHAQINAKAANIKSQVTNGTMPKTGTISSAQKATIVCWVNGGALNN